MIEQLQVRTLEYLEVLYRKLISGLAGIAALLLLNAILLIVVLWRVW